MGEQFDSTSLETTEFKDRYAFLIIAGVIQVTIGLLFTCASPLALIQIVPGIREMMESQDQFVSLPLAIMMALAYLVLAVLMIWTGIGAFLARRWVRPIMLCLSWFWLVVGILSTVMISFMMPRILEAVQMQSGEQLPDGAQSFIGAAVFVLIGVCYILLPGLLVLLYSGENVRATCEKRDPQPRWTDSIPTPALGLTLLLMSSALGSLALFAYPAVPLFNVIVTAPASFGLAALCLLLSLYLARACYRLQPIGWMGALIYVFFWLASGIVFSLSGRWTEFYVAVGYPEELAQKIQQTGMLEPIYMVPMMLLTAALWIGYLMWIKRYFRSDPTTYPRGG